MRRKWLIVAGVFVAAVAAGIALWPSRSAAPPPRPVVPAPAPPPADDISVAGKIRATHIVDIGPPQAGQIAAFFVDPGQEISEGQLLARLGNETFEASREQANRIVESVQTRINTIESAIIAARLEASRARAEASRARGEADRTERAHRRQQMLYGEGATPRLTMEKAAREYELAKSEFDGLEDMARRAEDRVAQLLKDLETQKKTFDEKTRELDEAKEKLESSEILSPVNGVLIGRKGEIGDTVGPETSDLFSVATDLDDLEVVADLDPNALKSVKPGQPALVIVAGAGDGLVGQVKKLEGSSAVIGFKNPNPGIRPGMTAQVRIRIAEARPGGSG